MAKTSLKKLVEEETKATTVADEESTETVTTTTKEKKVRKVFEPSDPIPCRSITQGALYIEGDKTKYLYEWHHYGDVTDIEYRDLIAMVRSNSKWMFNPNFIVEDEDFIAENSVLGKFYANCYTVKEMHDILDLPIGEMLRAIEILPKTALESFKSIASTAVANGTLDSLAKIKALDEKFDTDLNLLAEVFN